MKPIILASILIVSASSFAMAASYKKDYCNNQDYYTDSGSNDGNIYPHLHCASTWVTYSKNSGQHYNFLTGGSLQKGQANNACTQADGAGAGNLKGIIDRICTDFGQTCDDCQ